MAQPRPRAKKRRASWKRIMAWVVGIIVLLFVVGYAWLQYYPWTFPTELNSAFFFAPSDSLDTLYTRSGNAFVPVSLPGARALEATRSGGHTLFLLQGASGYLVRLDGTVVASSSRPIQNIALSTDGQSVAYAAQVQGARGSLNALDWHIFVVRKGTRTDIGAGFAPLFLGDGHLIHLSAVGIIYTDLAQQSSFRFLNMPFATVDAPYAQSPDHTLFGVRDPSTGQFVVYSVEHVAPPQLTMRALLPTEPDVSITLGDSAIYEFDAHSVSLHPRIWKLGVWQGARPMRIYQFPGPTSIRRISF